MTNSNEKTNIVGRYPVCKIFKMKERLCFNNLKNILFVKLKKKMSLRKFIMIFT